MKTMDINTHGLIACLIFGITSDGIAQMYSYSHVFLRKGGFVFY